MVRLLARVIGVGIETADMLVQEVLCRETCETDGPWPAMPASPARPTRAGPSDARRGLAKAGNARVRRGLIQLAWRFLRFQKDSALAQWYRAGPKVPQGARKTTMIVALARKLLIAFWRLVTDRRSPGRRRAAAGGLSLDRRRARTQSFGAGRDPVATSRRSRSEVAVTRTRPWLQCRRQNGPAASEPRRRSEWLLHGPGPTRIQPNTRSRREASRPTASSPRIVLTEPRPACRRRPPRG